MGESLASRALMWDAVDGLLRGVRLGPCALIDSGRLQGRVLLYVRGLADHQALHIRYYGHDRQDDLHIG
jgi:hypothetical protein